ncbi:hypothetical protein ACHAWF_013119 [Thalassiosira exigua]
MNDPFGYFYLLYKLHKQPVSTRLVCSDCGSLPHALGQWVDKQLQPIAKAQATYFKKSFDLKKEVNSLTLPPNASFTYDVVSLYIKTDTELCIDRLTTYLSDPQTKSRFRHYNPEALLSAIALVMHNNGMRLLWRYYCETAGWNSHGHVPSSKYRQLVCGHPRGPRGSQVAGFSIPPLAVSIH